jgi:hypothetical protein
MKTILVLTPEEMKITLTPETVGEERILDLMVFRRPENPNEFLGKCLITGTAKFQGHHSHNRVSKIDLIVKSKDMGTQ